MYHSYFDTAGMYYDSTNSTSTFYTVITKNCKGCNTAFSYIVHEDRNKTSSYGVEKYFSSRDGTRLFGIRDFDYCTQSCEITTKRKKMIDKMLV